MRTVVVTGASRGLGLASAAHLHRQGWRVVAAMRSVEAGTERLRAATGAAADDPRLLTVRLDLTDQESIAAAAKEIRAAVGAPDALVHNAGIAVAGCVEEVPLPVWQTLLDTNLLGPVALTNALLPAMREAGTGRIVVVSSQIGAHGFPGAAAYSATKSALERWAEALAVEVSPFGIGVTVVVGGAFDTEIITDAIDDYRDFTGPYAAQNRGIDRRGRAAIRIARRPEAFARGLAKALDSRAPFARVAIGPDARLLMLANRLLSGSALHQVTRLSMGQPRHGALRSGERTDRE